MMPPETEVIACPACRHVVRVPTDWLGQTVQCPECRATFTAPVRTGDGLTDPVLLAAPPATTPPAARKGVSAALLLPAFGLMLVGVASLVANGMLFRQFALAPDGGKEWLKNQLPGFRQMGLAPANGDADAEKQVDDAAAELAPKLRWVWLAAAAGGAVTFAGGLAMVLRRGYRLAQVACVVAAVNLPHLCCAPGALFGLWGLLMLMGDEGREQFGK